MEKERGGVGIARLNMRLKIKKPKSRYQKKERCTLITTTGNQSVNHQVHNKDKNKFCGGGNDSTVIQVISLFQY
jgi:hypothetical protein